METVNEQGHQRRKRGQAMNENKAEICEKLGELLKLTCAGADIDRIEYDAINERAVLHRADRTTRVRCGGCSGIALVRCIIGIL